MLQYLVDNMSLALREIFFWQRSGIYSICLETVSQLNLTYRYVDDVVPDLEDYLSQQYPNEFGIKDRTESNTSAPYCDSLLSIGRDS